MLLAEGGVSDLIKPVTQQIKILLLCTGNSARSIMAEAIFNTLGGGLFLAYSAGSRPTGKVHPMALAQIEQLLLPTATDIRSKSWQEFSGDNAPEFDLVLTVCDNAANEPCPNFAGHYEYVHWSFPDPAGSSDDAEQERAAFACCFNTIKARVETLVARLSANNCSNTASIAKLMRALS
ncbi:arsenate reductase ArsC [Dasania sp. GY-MA-18]|uniref:Arsenate reductase ArsC n=1 Tax=Dasania phycosphaerae TaxID=2950436 RepID=A0A9J6RIV6_9GAMM|nr:MULTISPECIES: arsenate reductase ArsC [Dasania]MCR8921869.1 arsenate reductase ArsC [Dasania sp. GY-MA-18]MCZ0864297.1 arsenate reductase ArsC [Dasania phycosphaerae]MCZ0868025.1 arsenate reductase ArsC [Dasania phycosphaerae]